MPRDAGASPFRIQLLDYLRGVGAVRAPPGPDSSFELVITQYRDYLVSERGLAEGSVVPRARVARLFLGELADPIEVALHQLRPGCVTGFVVGQCGDGRRGVAGAKTLTSGLRSLLVFLHVAAGCLRGWRRPSRASRGLAVELVASQA